MLQDKPIKFFIRIKDQVTSTIITREAFPMGLNLLEGKEEERPKRGYDIKLQGTVDFLNTKDSSDFTDIMYHFDELPCTPIEFHMTMECNEVTTEIYRGKLYRNLSHIDLDKCLISFETKDLGRYECLERDWNTEIPISSMNIPTHTINVMPWVRRFRVNWYNDTLAPNPDSYNMYQLLDTVVSYNDVVDKLDVDTIWVGSSGNPTSIYNALADPNTGLMKDFYLEDDFWIYKHERKYDFPQQTVSRRVYIIYDYGNGVYQVVKSTYLISHEHYPGPPYTLDIYRKAFEGLSLYIKDDGNGDPIYFNHRVDQGYRLRDVLVNLLDRQCGGISLTSDFFQWNPSNPSTTNYITATTNRLNNLMIYQKSDVKRPWAENKARGESTNVSLEFLLTNICKMFNCEYYLDDNNVLHIEHVGWPGWNNLLGQGILNLTTATYEKWMRGKRYMDFNNVKIPTKETFEFMESFNVDFKGLPIVYNTDCVADSPIEDNTRVEEITTDISACIYGVDTFFSYENFSGTPTRDQVEQLKDRHISDSGFVLMACRTNNNVWVDDGILIDEFTATTRPMPNNSLSWAHLHKDYFRYNRFTTSGTMNGTLTSFDFLTMRRNVTHAPLQVPYCDCTEPFTGMVRVITGITSEGVIDTYRWNFYDQTLNLTLSFPKI